MQTSSCSVEVFERPSCSFTIIQFLSHDSAAFTLHLKGRRASIHYQVTPKSEPVRSGIPRASSTRSCFSEKRPYLHLKTVLLSLRRPLQRRRCSVVMRWTTARKNHCLDSGHLMTASIFLSFSSVLIFSLLVISLSPDDHQFARAIFERPCSVSE